MKHGVITTKGILSAVIVVALGFALAGGSVSADKAHAEMIAQEKAIAAAKAEREAKLAYSKFEPVTEFTGCASMDIGDSVPGICAKEDASEFNTQIQTAIEEEEARLAAEAEAKAKAEQEAKEKAEREQREREEQARQEATNQNSSSGNTSSGTVESGNDSNTSDSTQDSSGDAATDDSQNNSSDSTSSSGGSRDVSVLYNYVGCPYKWGGTSPSGWDCSGFVQYVMKKEFGVSLPRTSGEQAYAGTGVSVSDRSQWKPGDLLIYRAGNGNIGHVSIYLGGGQMIHALNEKHDTFTQSVSAYDSWDSNTLVKVRRVLN